MKEVAQSIEKDYQVKTKIISFDFSSTDHQIYSNIEKETENLEVAILVNNVGMAPSGPFPFRVFYEEMSLEEIDQIVQVNISSQLHLIRIFYPKMIARKFGTIVNMSSLSGLESITSAGFTLYGATKAFNLKLSQNMNEESVMNAYGIEIVSATPGFVDSQLSKIKSNSSQGICSEEQVVRDTLNKLGYNYQYFTPWIGHVLWKYIFIFSSVWLLAGFKKKTTLNGRKEMEQKSQMLKKTH